MLNMDPALSVENMFSKLEPSLTPSPEKQEGMLADQVVEDSSAHKSLEIDPSPPSPTALPEATAMPLSTETPLPVPSPTATATLIPTRPPAFIWNTEIVQRAQDVGYFTTLKIDPQGFLHIGYFQDNSDMIWHAHNESGQWAFDYVIGGVGTGHHLNLSLDSDGKPHFAFHMLGKNEIPEIRYVDGSTGAWKLFRVYGTNAANAGINLDMDFDGNPYIAYLDGYSANIMYTHFSPQNGWSIQTVDAGNADSQSVALKLDVDDVPHIAYQRQSGGLYYSTKEGETWTRELVDESAGAGFYSTITLDTIGKPHIAYYDRSSRILKYAFKEGSVWVVVGVDITGDVGKYPSIVLDTVGQVYISYYDASNTALKVAHGWESQWDLYTVDNNGNVGQWNSIVLKPGGFPYVSYLDADNEDLKLAWAIAANP